MTIVKKSIIFYVISSLLLALFSSEDIHPFIALIFSFLLGLSFSLEIIKSANSYADGVFRFDAMSGVSIFVYLLAWVVGLYLVKWYFGKKESDKLRKVDHLIFFGVWLTVGLFCYVTQVLIQL